MSPKEDDAVHAKSDVSEITRGLTKASDVFRQVEVTAADLAATYRPCDPALPPATTSVDYYEVGESVCFIKPQTRIVDDNIKNIKADCDYSWADETSVFSVGHPGRVIDLIQCPNIPQLVHVVELVTSSPEGNVVMALPEALGPACWRGQFVMISDISMRCDTEAAVRARFGLVDAHSWADDVELRPFRTGRVMACLEGERDTLCLVRLEPPGLPNAKYCVLESRYTGDAAQWSKAPAILQIEGKEVMDTSLGTRVRATYLGTTAFAVPATWRGQAEEEVHVCDETISNNHHPIIIIQVLQYPATPGLKRERETAYGQSYGMVSSSGNNSQTSKISKQK